MPATRSPRSSSSLSSDSDRRLESIESPNFTFNDYVKLFNDDDAFYALQVALFERQDLTVKTHEIKHLILSFNDSRMRSIDNRNTSTKFLTVCKRRDFIKF